jgi:hypothetical protein
MFVFVHQINEVQLVTSPNFFSGYGVCPFFHFVSFVLALEVFHWFCNSCTPLINTSV